jgi:hypothetical protein
MSRERWLRPARFLGQAAASRAPSGDLTMIGNIKEHMDVIASDGNRIGRVDHVKGDEIELAKMDLETGFRHRMIPMSWVDHVDEHVHLNLTEDQAKDRWTDKQ